MRYGATMLCVMLVLMVPLGPVFAQERQPAGAKPNREEDIRHGAVLCAWLIYREVQEIGERCVHEKDAAFSTALDRAIGRIDAYIIENAPMSRTQLQESKKSRANMDPPKSICQHDGPKLYEMIRHQGIEGIDKGVASLLAVPRRPSLAPCL